MNRRQLTPWGQEAVDSVLLQLEGYWSERVSSRVTDRILRATLRRIHTRLAGQSIRAVRELANGGRVEVDHAIPVSVIVGDLLGRRGIGRDELEAFLSERIIRVQLTHYEHRVLLPRRGLADQMPLAWDGRDAFARYREAEIVLSEGFLATPTRPVHPAQPMGNGVDIARQTASRSYWEAKAHPSTVDLADRVLALAQRFDPELRLRYRRNYIGFSRASQPFSFAKCRPRKTEMRLEIYAPHSEQQTQTLGRAGLLLFDMGGERSAYRMTITAGDLTQCEEALIGLLKSAHDSHGA